MHTHTIQFCQPPIQPQPTGFPNNGQGFPNNGQGFPNNGQPYGVHKPMPTQLDGYAEIIGEGNIASIIFPDGSKQFIFYPSLLWPPQWRTFLQNPYAGNLNNPYMENLGVWFVRNIVNPIQPTAFPQQPRPNLFNFHYPRDIAPDRYLNLEPVGIPLQFHHDTGTSTTDIHYFIPKQFNWFQRPTECAAVQVSCAVENSATIYDSELSRTEPTKSTNEPYHCTDKEDKKSNSSQMSVDSKHSRRIQKSRKRSRKISYTCEPCECTEPSTSHKYTKKSSSKMSVDSTNSSSDRHKRSRKSKRSKNSSQTCKKSSSKMSVDSTSGRSDEHNRSRKSKRSKKTPHTRKKSSSKTSVDSTTRISDRHKRSRKPKIPKNSSNASETLSSKTSVDSKSVDSDRHKRSRKPKRSKKTRKSHVKCENKPPGSDKCVITFTEQAVGCAPDRGQKTQTICNGVPVVKVSKRPCNNMCQKAETWKFTRCSCDSDSSKSINCSTCCTSETE